MPVWLIVILAIVVFLVLWFIGVNNSLVVLRNKVRNQFSQIDVQLKKRFDLVPNLVETVKGYTKHEKETLEGVIKARNTYVNGNSLDDQLKADGELTNALNKLFALAESYPDLKANDGFNKLQDELSSIEEKIGYARQFYNDSVLKYNNKIDMFPSNLVASMFGFKKRQFFEAAAAERENVKVQF